ncbi:hypothetical protein SAMN04490182_5628 [Pseudomonas cedrina]|uniref:Uncharacterized protein n=1 Tax=Pseudomonas cedrina TaxID=651740 RepID=A0ABY0V2Y3_PSECE|nr:hypothetical protein SAMN04490182_5628 [Pseudomonas cedrina]
MPHGWKHNRLKVNAVYVGAGLPAIAVGQITNLYQTVRHRRQASSHRHQHWILELRLTHL